jgi:peptide/nickel transport system substrate-binding protein
MKLPAMLSRIRIFLLFCSIFALIPLDSVLSQELSAANLTGARGGNLVLAITEDPSSFNRLFASGLPTVAITERLSADLVHINRSTLQLEPSLATRWEADKTGRGYTVHLRRGVRFSDGSPFTADDVLFTFRVLTDRRIANTMAGQMEIDGAFPSISQIDDFTLKMVFQRPIGMGLRMLDSIPILPKRRLSVAYQEGRLETACGTAVNPADIVGLGPFRLKKYERGIRIVLERNPYYWKKDSIGQRLPYLDFLTFLIIRDMSAEALRFRQGELDVLSTPSLNPENYASLRGTQTNFTLRDLGAGLAMDYLWFNLNRGVNGRGKPYVDPEKIAIFEKPEFRRAVSHALNRPGIARSVFLGLGSPQYGIVSSGNREWYYPGIPKTEYDPGRARTLLAQIGLRDNDHDGILEFGPKRRPLELNLLTSRASISRERTAQVIRSNLLEVGIGISVQLLLQNEIASRFLDSYDYEAVLFGFAPTDVAPDLQTNLWYSSGSTHFWHPNQKKPSFPWESTVDSLISKLVTSMDPGIRKASFDRAQSIWSEQMPAVATIAPNILVGWSNRLGNLRPSILPPHLIWNAEEITKRTK